MDLSFDVAKTLNIPQQKVENTISLLRSENTIPFIARYRKEATGGLDEEQIRNINDVYNRLEAFEKRRETILASIRDQNKLTEELSYQIAQTKTITQLEDLYLPYRPKRRTRAMKARELGLEPLAHIIVNQPVTGQKVDQIVAPFLDDQVTNLEMALLGASDIIAEWISENPVVRQELRERFFQKGKLVTEKVDKADDDRCIYETYYNFLVPVKYIKPHQTLAINRAENEKVLRVDIQIPDTTWQTVIYREYRPVRNSIFNETLINAINDGAKRLLIPAIIRELRRTLLEHAEEHSITVFSDNLHSLLSQPPLQNQIILAIDPGFRTGSKVVVVDQMGKLMTSVTIYPHPPQKKKQEASQIISTLINEHCVSLVVIGNGTASRETEAFIAELIREKHDVHYLITSEAGASVYSASKLARQEFPNLDVSMRGAVSIARRVQDPLAELVKIDPKSIGVGLYQHDINQTKLSEALDQVVESVVNRVGVDVNTASKPLLTYVSGIGPSLAGKIVTFREKNGSFKNRKELLSVPGMGEKTFEQAAGFLRIKGGNNPLDETAIHPESYAIAEKLYTRLDLPKSPNSKDRKNAVQRFKEDHCLDKIAKELKKGRLTIEDILDEIAQPGRDPREDLPKPILRKDILTLDDLSVGMKLKGTIRNVVDFGAFVDIGVKIDGLVHRSKINPGIKLKVGDIIEVSILAIDHDRKRIALEMKE